MKRHLAAILAADVVGYSALMERDEAGTFARLKAGRKQLFEPEIERHHGRIFKLLGDGLLAEFASVVDAVECAVALQRGLAERNASVPDDERFQVRIGINLGEVIVEGEDRYGEGVNIAARLEELAEPGGIYVSGKVSKEVEKKLAFAFEPLGERYVKNIAEPVQVYRVKLDSALRRRPAQLSARRVLPWAAAGLATVTIMAAIWFGVLRPERTPPPAPAPSTAMPRIAVLPLDDMSTGADKGYLSDAIAEGVITELARSKTYAVIARNSSFRYRGQPTDARQIGNELGVNYLLEGSQQKIADRLQVTVQLIDAADGSHLWANTYNREIGDLFVVQEEIIRTLADRVGHRIERPSPKGDATQVSALHYHLMGRAELQKDFSAAGNERLRQFNLKAIEADPNAQFGYIGLAWSYRLDAQFEWHEQEHSHD